MTGYGPQIRTPADYDFPDCFEEFRPVQIEAADWVLDGPNGKDPEMPARRWMCGGIPTGSGKELLAQLIGREYVRRRPGSRFAVLTATKALEDQYEGRGYDLVDIRGRGNYTCFEPVCGNCGEYQERCECGKTSTGRQYDCEEGDEHGCRWRNKVGCTYNGRVDEAKSAVSVLSNYAYWMAVRSRNPGALEAKDGAPISLLIADEAHRLFSETCRQVGVWFGMHQLRRYAGAAKLQDRMRGLDEYGRVTPDWIEFLETVQAAVQAEKDAIEGADSEARYQRMSAGPEYRKLVRLYENLTRITRLGRDGNWIWRLTNSGIAFDCIWPARYTEKFVWSGVDRVVLMSATLRPKQLEYLGIPEDDRYFREWGRVFAAGNDPVYWVPTGKIGYKYGEEGDIRQARRIDEMWEIWGQGAGLKGIVHTNSYKLAESLQGKSKYGRRMILSKPGEAVAAAEKYRKSTEPVMLVSPSFAEGHDFPDEPYGWQVIAKVPYPDLGDPVVKTRMEEDRDWYAMETMQKLVQACGRKKRSEGQRSVTMITDDSIDRFRKYAYPHAPRYFRVMDSPGGQIPRPKEG